MIQTLRKEKEFNVREGGISLCRDGFHMNYLYGRYALACTWLAKIFGEEAGKISKNFLQSQQACQDFALLGKFVKLRSRYAGISKRRIQYVIKSIDNNALMCLNILKGGIMNTSNITNYKPKEFARAVGCFC